MLLNDIDLIPELQIKSFHKMERIKIFIFVAARGANNFLYRESLGF